MNDKDVVVAGVTFNLNEWYPALNHATGWPAFPDKPVGYEMVVETDLFMGLPKRFKFVREHE
jgi:hypothetical protein